MLGGLQVKPPSPTHRRPRAHGVVSLQIPPAVIGTPHTGIGVSPNAGELSTHVRPDMHGQGPPEPLVGTRSRSPAATGRSRARSVGHRTHTRCSCTASRRCRASRRRVSRAASSNPMEACWSNSRRTTETRARSCIARLAWHRHQALRARLRNASFRSARRWARASRDRGCTSSRARTAQRRMPDNPSRSDLRPLPRRTPMPPRSPTSPKCRGIRARASLRHRTRAAQGRSRERNA